MFSQYFYSIFLVRKAIRLQDDEFNMKVVAFANYEVTLHNF